MEVLTKEKAKLERGGVDFDKGSGGLGGEGGGSPEGALPIHTGEIGLWALLATITMLFAGFTSAYVVRRASSDWQPIAVPSLLWFNTALLLSSSVTLEVARSFLKRWRLEALKGWLVVTALLGMAFIAGQLLAWRQLAAQGVYLPTSPHSSFFFVLTGVHAVHLLGGVLALCYALVQAWRFHYTPVHHDPLALCATYWHFVDGLWIYLFLMLFVW
ncbi:MAG: cytochrome c oxidase subunit 3 [Acidobacteria bacterium]|nr:cytochrome c oxidase subunit 3 [Acidobacteriota bacterium]